MKKINIRLLVPGHRIVNNIMSVFRDTETNCYRVVNLSFNTIWAETFNTEQKAFDAINYFHNKFMIEKVEM